MVFNELLFIIFYYFQLGACPHAPSWKHRVLAYGMITFGWKCTTFLYFLYFCSFCMLALGASIRADHFWMKMQHFSLFLLCQSARASGATNVKNANSAPVSALTVNAKNAKNATNVKKPCQWAMAQGKKPKFCVSQIRKNRKCRFGGPWRKVRNRSGLEEKSRFGNHVPSPPK